MARPCDGCGEPPWVRDDGTQIPLLACTRCRLAFYHSRECQKQHYPLHKIACRQRDKENTTVATGQDASTPPSPTSTTSCKVLQTKYKGRCLVASSGVAAGQEIDLLVNGSGGLRASEPKSRKRARPIVPPVLLEAQRQARCAVCFGPCPTITSISNTRNIYAMETCSSACKETAETSGLVAEKFTILRVVGQGRIPKVLPTAIMVYRLILIHTTMMGGDHTTSNPSSPSWSDVCAMTCQQQNLGSDANDSALAHEQAIVMTVMSLLQATDNFLPMMTMMMQQQQQELIVRIRETLSRVKANAFSITDSGGDVLGTALFEHAAYLVNHACQPNAVQSFDFTSGQFPRLRLVTRQAIAAEEEITISYLPMPMHWTREERRKELRQAYHFDCQCVTCASTAG